MEKDCVGNVDGAGEIDDDDDDDDLDDVDDVGNVCAVADRSFEVKLPTIWTDDKQRWEESEKRRKKIREEKESSQKTEDAGAQKGGKVAKHCVFSNGRKVGSLKRRVRSQLAR